MAEVQHEKVIILGSGPAGLTAAIYAARATLQPLVIEGPQPGGQLTTTTDVENFPGFEDGIMGPDIIETMKKQAQRFGTRIVSDWIQSVDLSSRPFTIQGDEQAYTCDSLIVATGATARYLGIEGEEALIGKGLSACATCDGFFFRDSEIAVIGGGDSALEEAEFLTKFGKRVRLIHRRDEFRASKIMRERVLANPKIEVVWNHVIREYVTDANGNISGLLLTNTVDGSEQSIQVEGVFIAIGHTPNTGFLQGQLATDSAGFLLVEGDTSYTSVPGVFAAGDVHDTRYRQAITAAGTGCRAAIDCERWLEEQK